MTPSGVVSLANSLQPLQEHLNANKNRLRFLAGARAVQKAVLRSFPQADIHVSMVWVHMLPLDIGLTARRQAGTIADARVRHFHDPHKRVGKALAESLGAPGKTWWDVYLFYAAGGVWDDHQPTPVRWAHQLSEAWAEPAHRHRGDDLVAELHKAMSELTISPQDA